MVTIEKRRGVLMKPVDALEGYLAAGGTTILRAAFEHSFFVDPARVRAKTPWFPDRARTSHEHYPGKTRGQRAVWPGDGRVVTLSDNTKAQQAWKRYTGRLERGSGYSVRHIWGHPWDPDAFTAGWNLCYMPFWAADLTEEQLDYPLLQQVVRQAAWDLFFDNDPVCSPPGFVKDPGMDLDSLLGAQPLLILEPKPDQPATPNRPAMPLPAGSTDRERMERIKEIKKQTHRSWLNICAAVKALQDKPHEPFGTPKVAARSKSVVRSIQRETGLDPASLERLLTEHDLCR